jgi:sugar lactone lactonase YvrE
MVAIAIGVPVVLAIIVALAYLSFGAEARIQGFINQAEEEVALAQAAGPISEEARAHWEAVLDHANAAITLRPGEPAATAMQAQARAALDLLDGISRLQPTQLWDFGPGALPRQLVVHGQMIFVLDPAGGWVAQLALNPTGDGVVEQEGEPVLVQTGQQIGEGEVAGLVDLAWVGLGGERQTSGLLILEEGGALVSYDPAWVDEGGAARLGRSFLGTPPASPRAVGSFGDRFYVLDSEAGQIWRYEPRGNTYPERPDRYFVTPPLKSLADARDMAIDGNIYILYHDGTILKFLQGERQPDFDVRGLPDDIGEPVALAVDPDGSSDVIYVADRGNRRVLVLGLDGTFQAQFRADDAFDALEALAVDEAAGRLYVVSGGRLYAASLP